MEHRKKMSSNDELDVTRSNIKTCLEEIKKKLETFEKNLEEYDKCISLYSITDSSSSFMKRERDKVDKFYSDLRTSALKTFDDFVKIRVKKLKMSRIKYRREKSKLDDMNSELRKIEKMEGIKNKETVEKLMIQAGKTIDEPADIFSSRCYDITLPNIESMNIKIGLSENYQLHIQSKTPAVYFINCSNSRIWSPGHLFNSREILKTETKDNGKLFNYKDGQSIRWLDKEPNDDTIDLSLYKYMFVIYCERYNGGIQILKEKMNIKWCSRIVVLINSSEWDNNEEFVDRFRETAKNDNRVEVIRNDIRIVLDSLLEN